MTSQTAPVTDIETSEDARAGRFRVRFKSFSDPQAVVATTSGSTSFFSDAMDRVNSWVLPLGIAASFFAPDYESMTRRIRARSTTEPLSIYVAQWMDEDPWNVILEPVSAADVEELKRMWSLPYAGPVDFDYFSDSD